ncbi:MAG: farnesyl diphosphate synthase [Pseudohongiellaceae bacterium]
MNYSSRDSLTEFTSHCQQRVSAALAACLQTGADVGSARLHEAMAYACLKGGKRVRPLLAYAGVLAAGGAMEKADAAACAVEMIHCYSLIHDDLPAMDNDDLRRGIPSVHKAFDDATAILAGDALQSLAFQVLADPDAGDLSANTRLQMVFILARASGYRGMASGQALDFEAVGASVAVKELEAMHTLKTGALISASVQLGALSAPEVSKAQFSALSDYARHIGLAFQVQDDILDVTADTDTLGKPQGSDHMNNKPTYISLLGLEQAQAKATSLAEAAIDALRGFPGSADPLRRLAQFIVSRAH